MAAPGRNDPCPCGSGKKYKHCHLVLPQEATGITASHRSEAVAALMRYSTRPEFDDVVLVAALMWMGDTPDDDPRDALEEILSLPQSRDTFFEWLFFDMPLDDRRSLAEHLLDRQTRSLHPRVADYIRLMISTAMRLYQVREAIPGEGLRLRDLWSGDDIDVRERSGSRQLVVWDTLVARLHRHADGTTQVEGSMIALPPATAKTLPRRLKDELRRLRKKEPDMSDDRFFKMVTPVFHVTWYDEVATAPPPELRTPEGDPYLAATLEFVAPPAADALAILLEHDDFEPGSPSTATWIETASHGTRILGDVSFDGPALVLRTTSKTRGQRGRARLEALLGPLRLRRENYEAPEMSGDRPAADQPDLGVAVPEIASLLAQHDREWLDMSIPALDGATPRHAARDRRLRGRVIDLLIDYENRAARLARSGTPRDVTWMWSELGLKRP